MGKITFTADERDYTLEYDRASIKSMERAGFRVTDEFMSQPVTATEMLFYGALLKNHEHMTQNKAAKIYEAFVQEYDVTELNGLLIRMMTEALPNDKEDNSKKKKIEMV